MLEDTELVAPFIVVMLALHALFVLALMLAHRLL